MKEDEVIRVRGMLLVCDYVCEESGLASFNEVRKIPEYNLDPKEEREMEKALRDAIGTAILERWWDE